MGRKRKPQAIDDPTATDTITLRLVMNAFVRGVFAPQDSLFTFPKAEAEKRLKNTQYWVKA